MENEVLILTLKKNPMLNIIVQNKSKLGRYECLMLLLVCNAVSNMLKCACLNVIK